MDKEREKIFVANIIKFNLQLGTYISYAQIQFAILIAAIKNSAKKCVENTNDIL